MNTITTTSSQQLARLNLEILLIQFFGKLAKGDTSLIKRSHTGICENLYIYLKTQDLWLDPAYFYDVFRVWDEFSGDVGFPIVAPATFKGSASDYFCDSYKWGGEQLDARRALAKHVLANISMVLVAYDINPANSR
jgi:hypothetical protein